MPSSSQVHDHQFISRQFLELDNLIIGKREERRGELVKKAYICSLCLDMLTSLEGNSYCHISQKASSNRLIVVVEVEASKTCQSSFDQELGA